MTRQLKVVRREEGLDHVAADPQLAVVLDAAHGRPNLVWLLLDVLREYRTYSEILDGRGLEAKGIVSYVDRQRFSPGERSQALRLARALIELYRTHNEGEVRGLLLEQLVENQIRSRYAGSEDVCQNNVFIEIIPSDGRSPHTSSKSLDVVGWDWIGRLGEGHDCKVNAREWGSKKPWIEELEREIAPRGLSVALVTADSAATAERKFRDIDLRCKVARVLGQEHLVRGHLPLHK